MKKMIIVFLILLSFFEMVLPASAAVANPVSPRYTNASNVKVYLSISTSGTATCQLICVGSNSLNSTKIVTRLQQKVNGVWKDVRVWSHTSTSQSTTKTYSTSLSEKGEYKLTADFTLTGEGTETITATDTKSYK